MSSRRSRAGRAAGPIVLSALMIAVLAAPATAPASTTSLWHLPGTAPQPGPAILYAPPAQAPALENAPGLVWNAPPLLIPGASAYRAGEFTYQGYVYDDHGAKEVTDPKNPMHSPGGNPSGGDLFSAPDGTYDYPSGPHYNENAADLTELRVKPTPKATLFRISLNSLEDPNLVAEAIAN